MEKTAKKALGITSTMTAMFFLVRSLDFCKTPEWIWGMTAGISMVVIINHIHRTLEEK